VNQTTKFRVAAVLAAAGLGTLAFAAPALADWRDKHRSIDRFIEDGELRVYYTLKGEHALPSKYRADTDKDGTPDRVQNVLRQLRFADTLCREVVGLRPPLQSPRYKDKAFRLELYLLKMEEKRGITYDEVCNFKRSEDPEGGVPVLFVEMANRLPERNVTPVHEMFHLYQSGYTMFKNRWFTEGTSRWAEFVLHPKAGQTERDLPQSPAARAELFKRTYDADRFWNNLVRRVADTDRKELPESLRATRYVGDSKPVNVHQRVYGPALIKALLEELDRVDDKFAERKGLEPYKWKESQQRAKEHDREIWNALVRVCNTQGADGPRWGPLADQLDYEPKPGD
jgi:hypothetical protein